MADRMRRLIRRPGAAQRARLLIPSWERIAPEDRRVVQVCHPDWLGVKAATYAFRAPVFETSHPGEDAALIVAEAQEAGARVVVVQAWPEGSAELIATCTRAGLETRAVIHSSMAQHGADHGEAQWAAAALTMTRSGELGRVGFVKAGVSEAYRALGYPAEYLPNRVPVVPDVAPIDLGSGRHVGVFLDPYWRKNVTTQLGAAALLEATAHVTARPDVPYLADADIVEHGRLRWEEMLALEASMDLNLMVTLSECHPMTPMESYLLGVPCLISPTSALFVDDGVLWQMTTVTKLDDPSAIAAAASALLERSDEAVARARGWMAGHDTRAAERFTEFTS